MIGFTRLLKERIEMLEHSLRTEREVCTSQHYRLQHLQEHFAELVRSRRAYQKELLDLKESLASAPPRHVLAKDILG